MVLCGGRMLRGGCNRVSGDCLRYFATGSKTVRTFVLFVLFVARVKLLPYIPLSDLSNSVDLVWSRAESERLTVSDLGATISSNQKKRIMGLSAWWRNRGRDFSLYPKNENGDVLWNMAKSGDDLTKARKIDFFFIFREKNSALQFCERMRLQGFHTSLSYFDEKQSWDAECSIRLVPTHAQVTAVESQLSITAQAFDGKADGWGSFSQ
jgi:Regulator of ribonuclease activity B